MKDWLAIVNPAAGMRGDAERSAHTLLTQSQVTVAVETTRAPGHATELARAAKEFDGIIAVGGDGTIGEVLAGMDLARQRLAVIPAGRGNCLARDLGFGGLHKAITALGRGHARYIDLIKVEFEFCDAMPQSFWAASTLAIGYVCDVVQTSRRLMWLGRHAYLAAAAITVPRALAARITLDGGPETLPGLTGIVINNTAHLANFRAFTGSSLVDGQLDVMETTSHWPRQMLHNAAVLAGSKAFGPARMRQGPRAMVEFDAPGTIMIDGEILVGITRFAASCQRAAVACIVDGL